MKKRTTLAVLIFVIMLQGCAFLGIDLTDDRTITIIKSPYLINLSGDVAEEDEVFVRHTLEYLSTQPFKSYQFQAVDIHVTGSESESRTTISTTPESPVETYNDDSKQDEGE